MSCTSTGRRPAPARCRLVSGILLLAVTLMAGCNSDSTTASLPAVPADATPALTSESSRPAGALPSSASPESPTAIENSAAEPATDTPSPAASESDPAATADPDSASPAADAARSTADSSATLDPTSQPLANATPKNLPPRDAQGRLIRIPPASDEPQRGPRVVRPTRTNAPVASGDTQEITFDTIKFDIEVGQPFERPMLTPEIEALLGTKVRIRGYMLPSFQQRDIKQFVLVRDNMECCFGPGAALYDCIIVDMVGTGATYTVRPVAVEGVLTVKEVFGASGEHLAIYHLDGEQVR